MSCPISHCAKPSEKTGCFDRDDGTQSFCVEKWKVAGFRRSCIETRTDNDTHCDTLAEVGDMQDVRPVSEVRWGDEQGIAIGDTEEIRFVSGIMRVEGLAERTEIAVDAVESQSNTWAFLCRNHRTRPLSPSRGSRFSVNGQNEPLTQALAVPSWVGGDGKNVAPELDKSQEPAPSPSR
jgi:hypothetical protein